MISHCKDPYKPTRISWNVTKVGFERYTHMHQFHRMLKHQPEGTSKTLGQSRWPWVNLQLLVCNAYNPNQHHWEHAQNSWITNLNPPTIDGRIAPWKITWQILLVQVFFSGEIAPGNFSVKKPMFFFPSANLRREIILRTPISHIPCFCLTNNTFLRRGPGTYCFFVSNLQTRICPPILNQALSRWWQLKDFWNFYPEPLGKWYNLTSAFYFSDGVHSTNKQLFKYWMVKLQCFTKLLAGTLWDGGHLKECWYWEVFLDDIFAAEKKGPR